ncbi:MAG: hypothetical protein ABI383_03285 [Acidobacteriaceae bacterium]
MKTKRLRSRLERLLGSAQPSQSKRLSLYGKVESIAYTPVYSDFEARYTLYQTLRQAFPTTYRQKIRLRPAPLVRIAWSNEFPRAVVTRRLSWSVSTSFYGPFPSRKEAEAALHAALDLHLVRRCSENLVPDPAHPGCVYGEMNMCLTPCKQRVSASEYAREAHRLESFLNTLGEGHLSELAVARERANAALHFEEAGEIHAKWLKTKAATQLFPDCVRRLDHWNAVLLEPGSVPGSLRLFKIAAAQISPPLEVVLNEQHTGGLKQIGEALRSVLDSLPEGAQISAKERAEHLNLLQKWLFSTQKARTGKLILADLGSATPSTRRLAHAAERLLTRTVPPAPRAVVQIPHTE